MDFTIGDVMFLFIVFLPVLALLIWTYFNPEQSILWGERWKYAEEPEVSEKAIRFTKLSSLIAIILVILFFLILVLSCF
ncbi:hypothetical protein [Paenibacillus tuaregi]|uniref:hypothetical protein n=1 Tax=Paenibacillus tuaregi TaxID=1816681 RepID=UPI000AF6D547|nr:hypothetical protein [Paenibacillus tuaregi]